MRIEIRRDKRSDSFYALAVFSDGTEKRLQGCYQTVEEARLDLTEYYEGYKITNRSGFPG
jgi:hypothetical protein